MQKKNKSNISSLVLLAKQSGKTSFSSLWDIKHALNTDKVGHTGTLDSFADGLLVVLTGHLTHLVSHVTGMSKTYYAVVAFGQETDTLDPLGKIIKTSKALTKAQVEEVLVKFRGALLQTPPLYSAVHVDGKRASSLARSGKDVKLEPRQIFVYENELLDFKEEDFTGRSYALLKITCSKGTYIRSLARDIAYSASSCAHLIALRRSSLGPFNLEDAVSYKKLKAFTIENALLDEAKLKENYIDEKKVEDKELYEEIRNKALLMTVPLAKKCGFDSLELKSEAEENYMNGRSVKSNWFIPLEDKKNEDLNSQKKLPWKKEFAVFYKNSSFAGIIACEDKNYTYSFCVKNELNLQKNIKIFSYEDIVEERFPLEYKKMGTALSIGSFDGLHLGHVEILNKLLENKTYVPGVITFTSSVKNAFNSSEKDIYSLDEKLKLLESKGLKFAIVIDFSPQIATMDGVKFLSMVADKIGLKFLAEGMDFNCGYKGQTGIKEIESLSKIMNFKFSVVPDVIFEGERISSSRIRESIALGHYDKAEKMLGRAYKR